jgi:hypothetical protein
MHRNIHFRIAVTILVLATVSSFAAPALAAQDVRYCVRTGIMYPKDHRKIQISGTMTGVKEFGPPGYGENPKTDDKYTAWILRLDDPLAVVEPRDEFHEGGKIAVKDIQVWISETYHDYAALRGKHVVIQGELGGRETSNEVRRVRIFPDVVRLGGRIACDGSEQPLKK